MSIVDDVRRYYEDQGIAAMNFSCDHLEQCQGDRKEFTQTCEPYIGTEYERGTLPRLLFLSLDPGSHDAEPETRTMKAVRKWQGQTSILDSPKRSHWYHTQELALMVLRPFDPELSLETVYPYFAHTNSAKCCMNNVGRSEAAGRLFRNCRPYLPGEIAVLQPDILVTQGNWARDVIAGSFTAKTENPLLCGQTDSSACAGRLAISSGRFLST
jgi:hypothetical protein